MDDAGLHGAERRGLYDRQSAVGITLTWSRGGTQPINGRDCGDSVRQRVGEAAGCAECEDSVGVPLGDVTVAMGAALFSKWRMGLRSYFWG